MSAPHARLPPAGDAGTSHSASQLSAELKQACTALWSATLSLMTAFMQTPAPAHRYLLAQRIARNFVTLNEQECFGALDRATFGRLAVRWQTKADLLAPQSRRPDNSWGFPAFLGRR
jgi:hypothetical protein